MTQTPMRANDGEAAWIAARSGPASVTAPECMLLFTLPQRGRAHHSNNPVFTLVRRRPAGSRLRTVAPPEVADEQRDHGHEVQLADQHLEHREQAADRDRGREVAVARGREGGE